MLKIRRSSIAKERGKRGRREWMIAYHEDYSVKQPLLHRPNYQGLNGLSLSASRGKRIHWPSSLFVRAWNIASMSLSIPIVWIRPLVFIPTIGLLTGPGPVSEMHVATIYGTSDVKRMRPQWKAGEDKETQHERTFFHRLSLPFKSMRRRTRNLVRWCP
jgi:hypothetical protein